MAGDNFIESAEISIEEYLSERKKMVEDCLNSILPVLEDASLKELDEAMRYTLFAGGKRIRPILAIAIFEYSGGNVENIIVPACCIELFHTASLMIDDLPIMDNASFRRGKPVIHKVFEPQISILAATSLAAKGFEILSRELSKRNVSLSVASILIEMSAKMLGLEGASGGQFLDLGSRFLSEEEMLYIHIKKTCSLFYLCGIISAEIAQISEHEKSAILEYVRHVGLLFQLVDDYLDVNNDRKYNLVKNIGTEKIKLKIEDERNQAISELEELEGDISILKMIVDYIVSRCE